MCFVPYTVVFIIPLLYHINKLQCHEKNCSWHILKVFTCEKIEFTRSRLKKIAEPGKELIKKNK